MLYDLFYLRNPSTYGCYGVDHLGLKGTNAGYHFFFIFRLGAASESGDDSSRINIDG